jgi:antitoxin HicB
MISYPAIIKYDKSDKNYLVEFPDLPGCVTFGQTKEEALFNAEEALSAYLESIFDRGFKVPPQKKRKGKDVYYITLEASVAVPLMLRLIREEENLTQGDAARRLAYSYLNYQ